MPGYRPWAERELLKAEAEMRVRSGRTRADVSRELGIPIPTLSQWACQGGWRKKDLEEDRAQEQVRNAGRRILALRAHDQTRARRLKELMAEMRELLAHEGAQPPRLSPPDGSDWQEKLPDAAAERSQSREQRRREIEAHMPPPEPDEA
jgi:hypothetical protein